MIQVISNTSCNNKDNIILRKCTDELKSYYESIGFQKLQDYSGWLQFPNVKTHYNEINATQHMQTSMLSFYDIAYRAYDNKPILFVNLDVVCIVLFEFGEILKQIHFQIVQLIVFVSLNIHDFYMFFVVCWKNNYAFCEQTLVLDLFL